MHADRPIDKSSQDRFGRANFAKRIAEVIAERGDASSLVLGIYAPWGEGKSSVLNMIVEELHLHENVLIVRFNPWRFPDENQLLHKFFSTLAARFDASLRTKGEKLSGLADKYAAVLSPIPVAGGALVGLVKGYSRDRKAADLETLRNRIEEILAKSQSRIVVIMDDIDRLDNEEIHAIFRLVKLSADFSNTTYLLAFDEKRVAEALGGKYGNPEAGHNFLEKIVQVPLPLPPASLKALRALTVDGVNSSLALATITLRHDQEQRFAEIFDKAFLRRIKTPRLARRFANALTFILPITKDEVDVIDAIFLEAMRTFYPQAYASIRENPDVYSGAVFDALSARSDEDAKKQVSAVIESALKSLSDEDNKAARVVIQDLFPSTGASGLFAPGSQRHRPELVKGKRVSSSEYFPRYFNYGVPPDDISDSEVEKFLRKLDFSHVSLPTQKFEEMIGNERASLVISKLRLFEDELPLHEAKMLAQVLAQSGEKLPQNHPIDRAFGLGVYAQTSRLLRHLVQSIPDESEREKFALELADQIQPLPLAFDYSRLMRPLKRDEYSEETVSVVSAECEARIRATIASRIAKAAETKPIENSYPLDAQEFYQFWFSVDPDGFRRQLLSRLQSYPGQAAGFVAAVVGIDPVRESEDRVDFPQQQEWYEVLGKMIDGDFLADALQQTLGSSSESRKTLGSSSESRKKDNMLSGEERAARWFLSMKAHSDNQGGKDDPT